MGVVSFAMEAIRPRGVTRAAGFTLGVAHARRGEPPDVTASDEGDGIYFFNLDADDPVGVSVARRFFRLPYYSGTMRVDRTGPVPTREAEGSPSGRTVDFVSNRIHPGAPDAHLDVSYGPLGEAFIERPGSLGAFLVENYRFYLSSDDAGGNQSASPRIYAGDVDHEPWPLYRADLELLSTNFLAVNGFERPDETPIAHYSPGVVVHADRIRRVA